MSELLESFNITSPYLKALVTIAAFAAIAKIVDIFVSQFLKRLTRHTETDIDDKIVELIHKPLFITSVFAGVILSISYIELSEKPVFYLNGICYTVIVLTWLFAFIKISNIVIEDFIQKRGEVSGLRNDIIPFVENISKIILFIAGLMVLLSLWKVNITPLVASAGVAGAAVAFAAKDMLGNFFGGLSIFMDKPFKIGDHVVLDKGERGEVVNIGIRSTRIKTIDDILIIVPNSIIANSKVVNESAPSPVFRIRIPVSAAYGSDVNFVENILLDIAANSENILKEPGACVRFTAFGDSSLNLELLCWTREGALRGLIVHQLNSEIYKRFNASGVKMPFPQRDVHIYREEA
ncbi:MAG: mechanosensitive ion channel [Nitrospirae bacterium]|nr:mechanosensitive ion channel [Nitrospirota bacterium]